MTEPLDDRCRDCNRILVKRAEWKALGAAERRHRYDTHARIEARGICARDYNRRVKAGLRALRVRVERALVQGGQTPAIRAAAALTVLFETSVTPPGKAQP